MHSMLTCNKTECVAARPLSALSVLLASLTVTGRAYKVKLAPALQSIKVLLWENRPNWK